MSKINLHIANANQKFTSKEVAGFRNAVEDAQAFISNNFDFDREVDVLITVPSFLMSTIPEDGISGRTYSSQLIVIVVDTKQTKTAEDAVFETICHEISHALRWERVPEHFKTLFDGMILEGLAIALEEKAMLDTNRQSKQFFLTEMQNTDQSAIDDMIVKLKASFNKEEYDYETIFYSGDDSLPRWTGYQLGYYFVKKYMEQFNITINQATFDSYENFKP